MFNVVEITTGTPEEDLDDDDENLTQISIIEIEILISFTILWVPGRKTTVDFKRLWHTLVNLVWKHRNLKHIQNKNTILKMWSNRFQFDRPVN